MVAIITRLAMYKLIGGDQREYGPVSAEQVRRWIAEGRLNARSRARAESEREWQPLARFPEFQTDVSLHETPPPPISGPALPPPNPEVWVTEMLAREPYVPVGSCLSRSWELVRNNFRLLFTASALVWAISLAQFVTFLGYIAYTAVAGVLYGGLCLVFLKRIRGEPATHREVFSGFHLNFAQLALVGVVAWALTMLGFLCILPGVFLAVAWIFAVPLVVDKRLEFWSAMELSRKVVMKVWIPMFLLLGLALMPVLLVKIATGIKTGTMAAGLIRDVAGSGTVSWDGIADRAWDVYIKGLSLGFLTRLVFLLNLPFALGAVLYAYETLFGPRTQGNS